MDFCQEVAPPGESYRCVIAAGETVGVCAACNTVDICGNGLDDDCDGTVDNGSPETCNGEDDDCNGLVDDGLDEDRDTYSWCPTGPQPRRTATTPTRACVRRAKERPRCATSATASTTTATPSTPGRLGRVQHGHAGLRRARERVRRRQLRHPPEPLQPPTSSATRTPSRRPAKRTDMTCFNPAFQCERGPGLQPGHRRPAWRRSRPACPATTTRSATPRSASPMQALRLDHGAHVADSRRHLRSVACCSDAECRSRLSAAGPLARAPGRACPSRSSPWARTACRPRSSVPRAPTAPADKECRLALDDAYDLRDRYSVACGTGFRSRTSCSSGLRPASSTSAFSNATCIDRSCQPHAFCSGPEDCPTGHLRGGASAARAAGARRTAGAAAPAASSSSAPRARAGTTSSPRASTPRAGRVAPAAACTTDNGLLRSPPASTSPATRCRRREPPCSARSTCCADATLRRPASSAARSSCTGAGRTTACPRPLFGRVAMGGLSARTVIS